MSYICSHFQGTERSQYKAEKEIESLVTEFGPFHCEKNYLINFFKALLFLGMLLGNVVTNCLVGRISLKKIIVLSLGISMVNSLIFCLSLSITMANLGWFLVGFGMNGQMYYTVSIINEVVSPELESKVDRIIYVLVVCSFFNFFLVKILEKGCSIFHVSSFYCSFSQLFAHLRRYALVLVENKNV